MPCSGRCGESHCPELCLCTEVWCFLNYAYSRFSCQCRNYELFLQSSYLFLLNFMLLFQVFLCFANSVASTRFMLQDEFNLQTTKCDNCIIVSSTPTHFHFRCLFFQLVNVFCLWLQGFMFCLQQVACIFSCIACITGNDELQEASRVLNCCSDMVYCT